MTAPKRRWPRFTLRTLFVEVTVLGVALAWANWNVRQIRERERLFHAIDVSPNNPTKLLRRFKDARSQSNGIPWAWSLFGAKPTRWGLFLPSDRFTDNDLAHYREMFPEAIVVRADVDRSTTVPID
jgi:hypothetical protein